MTLLFTQFCFGQPFGQPLDTFGHHFGGPDFCLDTQRGTLASRRRFLVSRGRSREHLGAHFEVILVYFQSLLASWDCPGSRPGSKHEKVGPGANSRTEMAPIWVSIRGRFGALFRKLWKKMPTKTGPEKSFEKVSPRDGLICNPSTPAQSKHTFSVSHFF